jgi:tRNA dimethylallyltransferase
VHVTGAPPVVALFGATALGKSDIAVELASRLDADVVVADSMQVYAGLPVVTNQPGRGARERVRYHLVGWAVPQDEITVAEYADRAHAVVDDLLAQGRSAVVEGGSGLYVRAALGDLAFGAAPDEARRQALEARWEREPEALVAELRRRAPHVAERVDEHNARRVIRALESLDVLDGAQTGELWNARGRHPHALFALAPDDDRSALKERIDRRVEEMLAAGALEEVAAARAAGPFSRTAAQAIGVGELCAGHHGELALPEAAARMKSRTRALARRQLTWMRKLPGAALVPVTDRAPGDVAADIITRLRERAW